MKLNTAQRENLATKARAQKDHPIYENNSLWLEAIVESSDNAVISETLDGNIISWNPSAERIYGYTARELIGKSIKCVLPADRVDEIDQILYRIARGDKISRFKTVHVRKDGTFVNISKNVSPIKDKNGVIIGVSVIARDITEETKIEDEIMQKNLELEKAVPKLRLAEKIFESAEDGILVTDKEGIIQLANPSFMTTTGYQLEEIMGSTPRIFKSGYHSDLFYQDMWNALLNKGKWNGEVWNKRKNGDLYPEWLSINAIYDENCVITMYSAICRDLSQRLKYEEKIRHQAFHDALTGLPNRLLFQEHLDKTIAIAKRNQKSLAIFFLDIDGFKKVNDTLGHDVGDLLLQAVAKRLLSAVRSSDTVARMGGDEFTIILSGIDQQEDAAILARKVLKMICEPFIINEYTINVTTSIGISLYPQNGQDIQSLMKQADIAMYVTKKSGKNNYHFYSETK